MKRLPVIAMVAVLLASAVAIAGNTQVGSTLKSGGPTGHIYGRSDGVFQDSRTGSPIVVENGQRADVAGVGYRETFSYGSGKGITQLDSGTGGACAGNTTTVPCIATFGSGVKLAWFPVVTATLELAVSATGLNIAGDQTDNDGNELVGGVLGASGRPLVIGDDPAFYFCSTVTLADVSGSDDFHVGFRRAEPMLATFDNYKDFATIGAIGADLYLETALNDGATTSTDLTSFTDWADGATKTLCVGVGATGAAAYSVDGVLASQNPGFTFDDGDPVIPFVHFLHATDLMDTLTLSLWQVGYCGPDGASTFPNLETYTAKAVCDAVQ